MVGLGSEQHGNVRGEVGGSTQRIAVEGDSKHGLWGCGDSPSLYSFSAHAHFETFFQSTVLALVPMVLVNGAIAITSTLISQVSSDRPFEEAFASFTCELAIMFATRFVPTYDTDDILTVVMFGFLTAN